MSMNMGATDMKPHEILETNIENPNTYTKAQYSAAAASQFGGLLPWEARLWNLGCPDAQQYTSKEIETLEKKECRKYGKH